MSHSQITNVNSKNAETQFREVRSKEDLGSSPFSSHSDLGFLQIVPTNAGIKT